VAPLLLGISGPPLFYQVACQRCWVSVFRWIWTGHGRSPYAVRGHCFRSLSPPFMGVAPVVSRAVGDRPQPEQDQSERGSKTVGNWG